MIPGIRAIVLAAGESSRMGTNKLLLPCQDQTIITVLINNIIRSEVSGITVVLGAFRDEIRAELSGLPVQTCFNRDYKRGMLSSVKCGFRKVPRKTEAALIFPGDQPLITPSVINLLIREYRSSGKGIIIPVHKGKRGHPVLIDMKYRKEIAGLDRSGTLRDLIHGNLADALDVETGERGILKDIDTPEDYEKEIKSNWSENRG